MENINTWLIIGFSLCVLIFFLKIFYKIFLIRKDIDNKEEQTEQEFITEKIIEQEKLEADRLECRNKLNHVIDMIGQNIVVINEMVKKDFLNSKDILNNLMVNASVINEYLSKEPFQPDIILKHINRADIIMFQTEDITKEIIKKYSLYNQFISLSDKFNEVVYGETILPQIHEEVLRFSKEYGNKIWDFSYSSLKINPDTFLSDWKHSYEIACTQYNWATSRFLLKRFDTDMENHMNQALTHANFCINMISQVKKFPDTISYINKNLEDKINAIKENLNLIQQIIHELPEPIHVLSVSYNEIEKKFNEFLITFKTVQYLPETLRELDQMLPSANALLSFAKSEQEKQRPKPIPFNPKKSNPQLNTTNTITLDTDLPDLNISLMGDD